MTGLHTRGYRAWPGERVHGTGSGKITRVAFRWCFRRIRDGYQPGTIAMFQRARECLDAREAPDPLLGRAVHVEVGATRAEALAAYPLEAGR